MVPNDFWMGRNDFLAVPNDFWVGRNDFCLVPADFLAGHWGSTQPSTIFGWDAMTSGRDAMIFTQSQWFLGGTQQVYAIQPYFLSHRLKKYGYGESDRCGNQ